MIKNKIFLIFGILLIGIFLIGVANAEVISIGKTNSDCTPPACGGNNVFGILFSTNATCNPCSLLSVRKFPQSSIATIGLYTNPLGSSVAIGTFVGNNATFNYVLSPNTVYYLLNNGEQAYASVTYPFGGGVGSYGSIFKGYGAGNETTVAHLLNEITLGLAQDYLRVDLITPLNNTLITINTINFTANYSSAGITITNGTYYIYNQTGLFNKTTKNIIANSNKTNLTINNFIQGKYTWNVYGCGLNSTGDMNCSWNTNGNYTFEVGGQISNQIFENVTYETSSESFQANFSLFPGTNVISVYLVYNGTSYIVSDIINYGTSVELKKTIDIPVNSNTFIDENKTFFWSLTFSNGGLTSQNTTPTIQTVYPINIVYCNTTFPVLGLNFTTYDETNPNPKINATFHTSWSFWIGSGTIKKNYSFEDTTLKNSSFKFCINPNSSSIKTNLVSETTSPGFFPRTYYLSNATISNITSEIPLRLINDTLGVKFFHTIRRGVARINEANVIISKYDVGIGQWIVVGIRQSDDVGEFIEYLELDKDYTYSITQNGNFLGSIKKTSTCSATPCFINLDIESGAIDLWRGYYDAFAPNVVYNLSYDKTTHNVTYTFVDTSGLATYFRLQVNKVSANQTGILLCDKSLYTTVGTLVCGLGGQTGQFVAKGYVSRIPEKLVATLYGILSAIAETIGKNEGLFFTLLLVVVVGLIGVFNPVVGILLAGLAFIFAGIMGFIMISVTAMILVFLLVVILMIKMGRHGI